MSWLTVNLLALPFCLISMAAKTLGAKLDDVLRAQVLNRCQTKGCRPSDYLKDLIKRDFATPESQPPPSATAVAPKNEEPQQQQQNEKPQPVKIRSYIPPYIARFRCRGCQGKLHDNENYEGPPAGKCDSCHEKFMTKTEGHCPFCAHGEVERFGPEDIEELGFYSK